MTKGGTEGSVPSGNEGGFGAEQEKSRLSGNDPVADVHEDT